VLVFVVLLQPLDLLLGQNFTGSGEFAILGLALLPSFRKKSPSHSHHPGEVCFGEKHILGRWVLVLVGLLQPLDPLFDQNFTRTREFTM
jgi:hypothetical protein